MANGQTRIIGGTGTDTADYVLPPGVFQFIESINVTVDTSGSGDVYPLLTVLTQDGFPIADRLQTTAISGGGSGRATWALRLDNDSGPGALTGFLRWGVNTDTGGLGLTLAGQGAFAFSTGDHAFTLDSGGADFTVTTDGASTTPGSISLRTAAHGIDISRFGNQTFDALNATLVLGTQGGTPGFDLSGPGGMTVDLAGAVTIEAISAVLIRSHNVLNSGSTVTIRGDAGTTIGAPAGDTVIEVEAGRKFIVKTTGGATLFEITG